MMAWLLIIQEDDFHNFAKVEVKNYKNLILLEMMFISLMLSRLGIWKSFYILNIMYAALNIIQKLLTYLFKYTGAILL